MANLSDAGVDIVADKVGKELLNYINTVNESPTDYAIVYDGFDVHENTSGDTVISGSASGRWAYSNNLEGYFDAERVKGWLGVDSDYTWEENDDKRNEYRAQSAKQYAAYQELVKAIKDKDGRVEINYTDSDPAMGWMSSGSAVLEFLNGEVTFYQNASSEDLDITKYADMNGMSVYEAFESLHGDEPALKWAEYEAECEEKGIKPKDPQVWYDNDFDWE